MLTIQASQEFIKPGTYPAAFIELKDKETSRGAAYIWSFKCDDGKIISGISDANFPPTTKNKTGRWLAAISTKPLAVGVQVNPPDYYGKKYLCIVVDDGKGTGSGKLEMFTALN